jgi:hypothetical protein
VRGAGIPVVGKRTSLRRLSAAGAALAFVFVVPAAAYAYNPAAAASWADTHATSYTCWDSGHPGAFPCDTNDCQNFVSQALHYGGGYVEVLGTGDDENLNYWFLTKNGLGLWDQSRTWAYVGSHYTFEIQHFPGGWTIGTVSGAASNSFSGLNAGDILMYDWTSNGVWDHSSIQTTEGIDHNPLADPQKWGDLVDQHDTDRSRAWWTLGPYNAQRNITTIRLVRVASSN